MRTETDPGTAPAEADPPPASGPDTPPEGDNADGEKKPNRITAFASGTTRRTGEGARLIGQWLAHWASTADQSNDEIRRRLVAAQLEAYTERRTEVEAAFGKETKKVVRLEEEAADGGLTQAQRGQLTFSRETARRLEKTLKEMRKADFRPVQPTERQIARARSFGRLRRGGALIGAAGGAAAGAVNAPPAGLLALLAATGLAWWTAAHPPRLTHRPVPAELLLAELDPPAKPDTEIAEDGTVLEQAVVEDPALFCAETDRLTMAMLSAGAISEGRVRLAAPDALTRLANGWMAKVVLPKGDGANVETVLPKLGKIAGEMDSDRDRFFMEAIHASAGGNAKTIAVAMFDTDPFLNGVPSPLVGATTVDVWNRGIPVAVDAFGQIVYLVLRNTSLSLGGASRSGKGAALRGIIGGALLDMRVNVRLIDGKAPGQDRWRNLAATFIDEEGNRGAERALHLLEAEVREMSRRAAILKKYGVEDINDPKLIDELGGLELVVMDEVLPFTENKKFGNQIKQGLAALSARGLAFGIILILATQVITKGENGVIPRLVSGNISWKWAMRTTDTTESNMALAPGAASSGWDASKLDPDIKGMGILFAEAGYKRLRSLWIDGDDMLKLIANVTTARARAGRLRGQWDDPIEAALHAKKCGTPAPELPTQDGTTVPAVDLTKPGPADTAEALTENDWQILTATADTFGGQLNVLCRQVAEALQAQDGTRWADTSAATVGDTFRRAGVFRKTVRVAGQQSSTGAALDDIRALIKERTVGPGPTT
ncbi:hypothetical protein F7Q99_38260 [Streptomyces kaniharaensis]|uniref:FtsK domain-containing protein n=1 Tax=Streptomyces kaniharaensis TaxID=212423 RepID=A0A6N7L4Q2_9ACTN|nr:FtsK/SpoIIIE domain-containing protein [Streptomyces kaniharaensis]MQS17879.1 hypothetical protein [Streptomyces kaniharaensis]